MDNHEAHLLSRRRFLASASAVGTVAWIAPRRLFGEAPPLLDAAPGEDGPVQQFRQAAAKAPVRVQRLRGRASIVTGSGCNVVALASDDGVLLVDSGIVGAKVAAAVANVSGGPVKHVINTHWHFDHTDGNEWLHARGAAVIAHENTRRHLSVDTRVEEESLSRASADTIIVPGHSTPGRRRDLAKFKDMLTAIRDRVAVLKAQGRTASEVVAAKLTADFDAAWGGWLIGPDFFARLVYKGV